MKNCVLLVSLIFFSSISIGQHVGIGTNSPANPLHIKSASEPEMLRIEGPTPYISFFNGTTYKGYVWYDGNKMVLGTSTPEPVVISPFYTISPFYFMPTGRLGLGINNPAEKLDVDGNINLNGVIKVNGNSGTVGQVLTSNGTADPQWKNAAYGNNTRFCVLLDRSISGTNEAQIYSRYNLNPSDISIGASSITVNRAGLYHFDFFVSVSVIFPTAPSIYPGLDWILYLGSDAYSLVNDKILTPRDESKHNWTLDEHGSLEIYIPAATTLTVHHSFLNFSFSFSLGSYLTGHLISE